MATMPYQGSRGPMKIGVVLPISENEQRSATPGYAELRAYALQAEAAGFDSIWLYDHLLFRFPDQPTRGIWEIWTLLAALAEATERVEIGTLVMCTAFRNPALLAKMAATAEEVSGGRLILGLGAGWHQPEFDAFGQPFDHRVDRFEEALQIIVPLLREGRVDMRGTYYSAPDCVITPRGPRPAGPPILIGAFRPRMLQLTAQYADSWNTCWLGEPIVLPERRAALEAACAQVGRDPATLDVTVGVRVDCPTTGSPPAAETDPAKLLTGTADAVADGLRRYAEQGVAHLICALEPGDLNALGWFSEVLERYRRAPA